MNLEALKRNEINKEEKEQFDFETFWKSLKREDRELIKAIIIERIKLMPNHFRLSIG